MEEARTMTFQPHPTARKEPDMHVGSSQFQSETELEIDRREYELDQQVEAEAERYAREAIQFLTEDQKLTRQEALATLAEALGPSNIVRIVVAAGWGTK
jgi:phage gp46-like protein